MGFKKVFSELLLYNFLVKNLLSPNPYGLYLEETNNAATKNCLWVRLHTTFRSSGTSTLSEVGTSSFKSSEPLPRLASGSQGSIRPILTVLETCHICGETLAGLLQLESTINYFGIHVYY